MDGVEHGRRGTDADDCAAGRRRPHDPQLHEALFDGYRRRYEPHADDAAGAAGQEVSDPGKAPIVLRGAAAASRRDSRRGRFVHHERAARQRRRVAWHRIRRAARGGSQESAAGDDAVRQRGLLRHARRCGATGTAAGRGRRQSRLGSGRRQCAIWRRALSRRRRARKTHPLQGAYDWARRAEAETVDDDRRRHANDPAAQRPGCRS